METIREKFRDKDFSEEALNYLENAINEFEEVFGNFVSREDLIERLKNTIDKIEFVEKIDSGIFAMGCYFLDLKKVQIVNKYDEETTKSVFFHEFLHAIVANGKNDGFYRAYKIEDFDEEEVVNIGSGWNEGFVQMLTQERDKKVTGKVISKLSYPVLTESVTKFTNLFGRNELIDLYFNHADEFLSFMYEKCEVFGDLFLINFDVIQEHEKEIFAKKIEPKSMEKRALLKILGKIKRDTNNQKLKNAQESIMQIYLDVLLKEKIENPIELQNTLKEISEMYKVLSKTISVQTIQRLIEQSNYDILSNLGDLDLKTQVLLENGVKFENLKKLNVSEKIKILMDKEFVNSFFELDYEYPSLMEEYFSSIMTELYSGCEEFKNKDLSTYLLYFSGVARYIDENNLSFENLRIMYNEYDSGGVVFELFNFQESGEYEKLSTLVIDNNSENYDAKKYKNVEIGRLIELRERISKEHSIEIDEAAEDENGNYIVYDDNGQAWVSMEFNEIERPYETMSFESTNEMKLKAIEQKIARRMDKIKHFQELRAPDIIIYGEKERIEKAMLEKDKVLESIRNANRKKITPHQIESKTINGNVTIQTMQDTLAELAMSDKIKENEGEDLNVE